MADNSTSLFNPSNLDYSDAIASLVANPALLAALLKFVTQDGTLPRLNTTNGRLENSRFFDLPNFPNPLLFANTIQIGDNVQPFAYLALQGLLKVSYFGHEETAGRKFFPQNNQEFQFRDSAGGLIAAIGDVKIIFGRPTVFSQGIAQNLANGANELSLFENGKTFTNRDMGEVTTGISTLVITLPSVADTVTNRANKLSTNQAQEGVSGSSEEMSIDGQRWKFLNTTGTQFVIRWGLDQDLYIDGNKVNSTEISSFGLGQYCEIVATVRSNGAVRYFVVNNEGFA